MENVKVFNIRGQHDSGLAEAASQVVGGCNPLLAAASRCPLVVLESFPKKRKGFIVPTQMRQRQSQIVGPANCRWQKQIEVVAAAAST